MAYLLDHMPQLTFAALLLRLSASYTCIFKRTEPTVTSDLSPGHFKENFTCPEDDNACFPIKKSRPCRLAARKWMH